MMAHMRYLEGEEKKAGMAFIGLAREVAEGATCQRSRCGCVIVKDGDIIGRGYNSPANDLESQRRCHLEKGIYDSKVTDKTCCIHAEQRAIMDALARNPDRLRGSRLFFIRIDDAGEPKRSGEPYCTICSKMSLDAGIGEFVLYREDGLCAYETGEYNDLSYKYNK